MARLRWSVSASSRHASATGIRYERSRSYLIGWYFIGPHPAARWSSARCLTTMRIMAPPDAKRTAIGGTSPHESPDHRTSPVGGERDGSGGRQIRSLGEEHSSHATGSGPVTLEGEASTVVLAPGQGVRAAVTCAVSSELRTKQALPSRNFQ